MKKSVIILFVLFAFSSLFAEIISDKHHNFSVDLPEGFNIVQADEEHYSYLFSHPNIPVSLVLKVENKEEHAATDVFSIQMRKLKATYEEAPVYWRSNGGEDLIGSFEMTLDKEYKGWGVTACLESDNGFNFITLLAYAPKGQFDMCQQFIISLLNSLTVNDETCEKPGIFMAYAFPKEGNKNIALNIGKKKISTTIDKSDEEASQYLVDLEFAVLSLYANHPLWKEAWQRYYRLVFRDNYGRLSKASKDIHKALYEDCKKARKEDPDTEYVSRLLSWVQGFKYERNQTAHSSDLTPPVLALCGDGNDCDSRSLLLCCIMQKSSINSILLISREYSHALCAFDVKGQGQRFETDYGSFLMCETTAPVTPGMIAQEHADRSKWILVD
ncbi:MAG: hypothetical protein HUK25_10685 [Treponema sp.]|nr:hypothetical protein [Treponema sp.]